MFEDKIDFNVPMGNVGRYSLCIMKLQQNNNEKIINQLHMPIYIRKSAHIVQ